MRQNSSNCSTAAQVTRPSTGWWSSSSTAAATHPTKRLISMASPQTLTVTSFLEIPAWRTSISRSSQAALEPFRTAQTLWLFTKLTRLTSLVAPRSPLTTWSMRLSTTRTMATIRASSPCSTLVSHRSTRAPLVQAQISPISAAPTGPAEHETHRPMRSTHQPQVKRTYVSTRPARSRSTKFRATGRPVRLSVRR